MTSLVYAEKPLLLSETNGSTQLLWTGTLSHVIDDNQSTVPEESDLVFLSDTKFLIPINGYVTPLFIVITLITNCFICAVLLRQHMRSPTNVVLVAMAASDMLTGVWSLPFSVYLFMMGGHSEWVSFSWCPAYFYMTDLIPTVFHTSSIWLTVVLAVERYIYVCHPLAAKRICSVSTSIRVALAVFVAAFLSQVTRFVDTTYVGVAMPSKRDETKIVVACQLKLPSFIQEHDDLYFNVYYWFRVVFIHLVPCSALVLLTALLVIAMRRAERRKNQLLKQNRRTESRRLAETNYTTLMLVTVVVVFLLVEFPLAVILVLYIAQRSFDLNITDPETYRIVTLFVNMAITLSYPVNFLIYCAMSRQFRSTFRVMFCRRSLESDGPATADHERDRKTNYVTLPAADRIRLDRLPPNAQADL